MRGIIKRIVSVGLVLSVSAVLLAGCGQKQEPNNQPDQSQNSSSANDTTQVYPIKTDITLTEWVEFSANATSFGNNDKDLPFYKDLEKKTGIKVDFIHPAAGQSKEVFNLLLASGDLPDMIHTDWINNYPAGPDDAINKGIIADATELINKYSPNYKKLLESDKDLNRMMKTESGKYYCYPRLTLDPKIQVVTGPMLRKDWLDDLKLDVPTTIDDWYKVLKALKEQKGVESPLTIYSFKDIIKMTSTFVGAYGIKDDFYMENGKVIYGPMQPAYKNYLATMNKWYKEGLLDKDFATTTAQSADAKMLSGKAGAIIGNAGGTIGKYLDSMKATDPKYNIVAAPYPTLNKGEKPKFGRIMQKYTGMATVITAKSKNKELAARWLDYGFSEEGNLTMNFGEENVSYKMENGYPKYTDLITKNPDKLSIIQALTGYTTSFGLAAFVQDERYYEQYLTYDQQRNALDAWLTDEAKYLLPPVSFTADESSQYASIMNDINTYKEEMMYKFIMGQVPLDDFDKYVDQMKKMQIQKAVDIQQAALDRYNKR